MMTADVFSVQVESSRAAIKIRAPEGSTLVDAQLLAQLYAHRNERLAPLVWVWCWSHGMREDGPACAFAFANGGKVLSHRIDPALLVTYYMPLTAEA